MARRSLQKIACLSCRQISAAQSRYAPQYTQRYSTDRGSKERDFKGNDTLRRAQIQGDQDSGKAAGELGRSKEGNVPIYGNARNAGNTAGSLEGALSDTETRRLSSGADIPRPSTFPRVHLDLAHIRQNPGLYETNCIQRNNISVARNSWRILELHQEYLKLHTLGLHNAKARKKCQADLNLVIKTHTHLQKAKTNGEDVDDAAYNEVEASKERLILELQELRQKIDDLPERMSQLTLQQNQLAVQLPNLTAIHVPVGGEPEIVEEVHKHAIVTTHQTGHEVIGTKLGIIDITAASRISGTGFYYLSGAGALLEQALVQYALKTARKYGWQLTIPPSLTYHYAAKSCGFQPREDGHRQIYTLEADDAADLDSNDQASPQLALTGTSEIPLAGMFLKKVIDPSDLPIRKVAVSRCYRAEAGGRGKETKGLYRVHEFTKVELFAWSKPDEGRGTVVKDVSAKLDQDDQGAWSAADSSVQSRFSSSSLPTPATNVFNSMLALQLEILKPLGLPLRVLNMPATDLGASAVHKIDVEAHFPGRPHSPWGELSSLSSCSDYQTRRFGTRIAGRVGANPGEAVDSRYPWTLNGTALAVPRVIAALLENGWDTERQVVRIPKVLQPYMDDMEEIKAEKDARSSE